MPHRCKIAGIILLGLYVLSGIVLWLCIEFDACNLIQGSAQGAGVDTIILVTLLMLIAFSREKDEDEYVAAIRGKYLMLAFYVDFVLLVVALLTVRNMNDLYGIAVMQILMILFLHVVMFNIAMAVISRRRSREE
jgi:hypothetical protein